METHIIIVETGIASLSWNGIAILETRIAIEETGIHLLSWKLGALSRNLESNLIVHTVIVEALVIVVRFVIS